MTDFNFNESTTVRDVLTNFPQTFDVFQEHGMCASCKASPPPVPLAHFATKHGVALDQLISELSEASNQSSG